ncbi:50S ribosomal protein L18Ae [[Eubacterium] cellulosolvens]
MTAKQPKGTKPKSKTAFLITGNFRKGKKNQKFTKEVIVTTKQNAEEYIYSILGSKHRVKRREITISKIEELPNDKITDPIIKQLVGGK